MYSLPLLEREIASADAVYGNTVSLNIAELVERGIATPKEIDAWSICCGDYTWLEGASESVIRNVYHSKLRKLVRRNGRYFTHLFVNRTTK